MITEIAFKNGMKLLLEAYSNRILKPEVLQIWHKYLSNQLKYDEIFQAAVESFICKSKSPPYCPDEIVQMWQDNNPHENAKSYKTINVFPTEEMNLTLQERRENIRRFYEEIRRVQTHSVHSISCRLGHKKILISQLIAKKSIHKEHDIFVPQTLNSV